MNKKDIIRVIAVVLTALMLACICVMFVACAPADTDENITRAIIFLPNGESIEGVVTSKYTMSNGTITIEIGGKAYTTHYANVLLISE